jgi:hypothetical protein
MSEGDSRLDSQADHDWHRAYNSLFALNKRLDAVVLDHDPLLSGGSSVSLEFVTALAASSVPLVQFDVASAYTSAPIGSPSSPTPPPGPHLNAKTIRRILAARETIFKYGIYLPRSDHDADTSPESVRWKSGRQLEWLRLKTVGAFEYDWTIARVNQEYPDYQVSDIG